MHTYTHHFIPIHTYIHTTDHVTPQYVATNLEFFVKNTLYGNGSKTLIFQQICNFFKDSESLDTYLCLGCPQLVPYYCDLLSNLHPKWHNFRRKCRASK